MMQRLTTALLLTALLAAPALAVDRANLYLTQATVHHVARSEPCRVFTEAVNFLSLGSICKVERGAIIRARLQWRGTDWYQRGEWSQRSCFDYAGSNEQVCGFANEVLHFDTNGSVVMQLIEPGCYADEYEWCEINCGCREDDCP